MYIKFHTEDIEVEVGGFDGTYEIGPIIENTVRGVKDVIPDIKEICEAVDKLNEIEENPPYPIEYKK